jgi:anti-anti-sigma factor
MTAGRMEFYYDEIDREVLVLAADGGLNSDTSREFVESIEKLVDAGLTRLIVDCTRLTSISSYGLGVLVALNRRMRRRGGEVKICAVRGLAAQALQVTRLDRLFELYPDVGRARLAFRPRTGAAPRDAAAPE